MSWVSPFPQILDYALEHDQTWVEGREFFCLHRAVVLLQEGDLLYHGEQDLLAFIGFQCDGTPRLPEPTAIWWESPPHLEAGSGDGQLVPEGTEFC